MSEIHQLLNKYRDVIKSKGFPIDDYLFPPLQRSQILEYCAHLPFTVPEEIIQLYEWHNGVDSICDLQFFRDNQFSTIEEAIDNYNMIKLYFINKEIDYGVDLEKCFPFAEFDGAFYVLPAGEQKLKPEFECPVISFFQGIEVFFIDIPTMLKTCIAWYEEGVYKTDDFSVDAEQEIKVWKRLNPGVFV